MSSLRSWAVALAVLLRLQIIPDQALGKVAPLGLRHTEILATGGTLQNVLSQAALADQMIHLAGEHVGVDQREADWALEVPVEVSRLRVRPPME